MKKFSDTFTGAAAAVALSFGLSTAAAQDTPPTAPTTTKPTETAVVAVTAKAVDIPTVLPKCEASAQNLGASFFAGAVKHLLSKSGVDGAGDVAGQLVEARLKTAQPSCAVLNAQTVSTVSTASTVKLPTATP